ncbi:DUF6953 family protein [Microbacterium sp. NPDC058062]|uniref:DUF6953 family protein n=1 Tax=Microbacterium sp. NPDC058062 TaxID=3346320 RepID=UPI0036DA608F
MGNEQLITPLDIAQSIIAEIQTNGQRRTYQSRVVRRIREEFGEEWSYKNHNGNWAIDRKVLTALGPLKSEHVIWDRSDQSWRIVTDEQLTMLREREERRRKLREERAARKA